MLTHDVLETQMTVELPAREMLAWFNFSRVTVAQGNANLQGGFLNINLGQVNNAGVVVIQD